MIRVEKADAIKAYLAFLVKLGISETFSDDEIEADIEMLSVDWEQSHDVEFVR